ncbi:MAG TPA: hypothetical protein VGJ35_08365 [Burkholderiaceae bacterium]|jgi:hypothetical protein
MHPAVQRIIAAAAITVVAAAPAFAQSTDHGVRRVRSAYSIEQSIVHVKALVEPALMEANHGAH